MIELFKNELNQITYDEERSTISYIYFSDPEEKLTDEGFKKTMIFYGEMVQQYKPERLFVDFGDSPFIITPELQEWTAKEVAPMTMCLRKLAFVVSTDIFSHVSTEQMMGEEGIAENYDPRYFTSVDEAKAWLWSDL